MTCPLTDAEIREMLPSVKVPVRGMAVFSPVEERVTARCDEWH